MSNPSTDDILIELNYLFVLGPIKNCGNVALVISTVIGRHKSEEKKISHL